MLIDTSAMVTVGGSKGYPVFRSQLITATNDATLDPTDPPDPSDPSEAGGASPPPPPPPPPPLVPAPASASSEAASADPAAEPPSSSSSSSSAAADGAATADASTAGAGRSTATAHRTWAVHRPPWGGGWWGVLSRVRVVEVAVGGQWVCKWEVVRVEGCRLEVGGRRSEIKCACTSRWRRGAARHGTARPRLTRSPGSPGFKSYTNLSSSNVALVVAAAVVVAVVVVVVVAVVVVVVVAAVNLTLSAIADAVEMAATEDGAVFGRGGGGSDRGGGGNGHAPHL